MIVFDAESRFYLEPETRSKWRQIYQSDFQKFYDYLLEKHPSTCLARFLAASSQVDDRKSFDELKVLASSGFYPASFLVSYAYEYGEFGQTRDHICSRNYFLLSVAQMHPHANWLYGIELVELGRKEGINYILASAISGFGPSIDYLNENYLWMPEYQKSAGTLEHKYDF
jgi:hypothetical protein